MAGEFSTQKLIALSEEWKACQPLKPEDERRLWKKIRLDWNYHSNHIEGNTLTYGETELLLIHGQTHGSHELRDYEEMKAHDLAIHRLRETAKENRPLTEAEIRTLNEITLKEPFWTSAITPDGMPTRKQVIPGQYKTSPNSVRTATGEIFEFATPLDVPAKMAALVRNLNNCIETGIPLLPEALAKTHHEFLLIHPFDDGNGRVARLILNYILFRRGLLPIVIPTTEKSAYLSALREADVGKFDSLANYVGEKLCIALTMGSKAARGESIEELSDVEKELALLVKDHSQKPLEAPRKSVETLRALSESSLKPLFTKLEQKTEVLEKLFQKREVSVTADAYSSGSSWNKRLDSLFRPDHPEGLPNQLWFAIKLSGYSGKTESPFDYTAFVTVVFDDYRYCVKIRPEKIRLYSEIISSDEIEIIVQTVLKDILERIKSGGRR
jgi:Fic family protein